MATVVLKQINDIHKKPDVTVMSSKDLLIARDEAMAVREDLNKFFSAHYRPVTSLNDSNPAGFPFLTAFRKSECVINLARSIGYQCQQMYTELTELIELLEAEILARHSNRP